MLAIHAKFTRQMRNRLRTTCMGLGLVRLLQDAKRFEEAKIALTLLEEGALEQKRCKANRIKDSDSSSTTINVVEALARHSSIA